MLTVTIEDRPYYCHRPVPCTALLIAREEWPGQEFGFWLPETVLVDGEVVRGNWLEGGYTQQWRREGDALAWAWDGPGFTLTSTLRIDQARACLWFAHAFRNTGDAPLTGLDTKSCFHLMNAPRFVSIRGERYWAMLDGAWTTTDTVPRHLSPDPHRVIFRAKGLNPAREVIPQYVFPAAVMPQEAHHPLFIAESLDGAASVAIAARDMRDIFNNNDYILRCLHSEPAPLPPLAPGAAAAQEGVILFVDGDHAAALARFAEVTAGRW